MTGEPLPGGPEILELSSVPGFVVFDLPGAAESAGGTRLAPDVSVAEVALLARAMTYKFAALGEQTGGRTNPAGSADVVRRADDPFGTALLAGRHFTSGLTVDAVRISRAESVPVGGTQAPAQRIETGEGHQGDHGNRDRRRHAENHDR